MQDYFFLETKNRHFELVVCVTFSRKVAEYLIEQIPKSFLCLLINDFSLKVKDIGKIEE